VTCMVDMVLIQQVSYIAGTLGVCVAARASEYNRNLVFLGQDCIENF